jgi:Uma2 family endonuclease
MSAVLTPPLVLPEDYPNRFRWRSEQFYQLARLGYFGERKVELLDGVIYDKYPAPHEGGPGQVPVRFTREQYRQLAELGFFEGRRVELLYGEVVEMSPQGWPHVVAKSKAADVLREVFAGTGWVSEQSPFPTVASDPEPDVVVVPGRREDYMDHPTVALLVVEVADTTLDRDTTVKAEMYATVGVEDYWVLDLAGRRLLVFRDPRPIPDGGAAYRTRKEFGPSESVTPVNAPTASVRVADLLP